MRREAARTLHSLVARLPAGHRRPRLRGHRRRERLGPRPAPRRGLRRGLRSGVPLRRPRRRRHPVTRGSRSTAASRIARGERVALMIDGAHVLTPGVLRFGMTGLRTYAPAIVATQQWYVGPGQQGDAMADGYDQAYEDRLFDADRVAGRRLPALRDRPLHRRPRLVRRGRGRATASSCRAAARAGRRRSTRASPCAGGRLRQPRALRARSARRPTSPS